MAYTDAEKAAYKAGKAASGKAPAARTRRTAAPRLRKAKAKAKGKKRSGCILYESYKGADGKQVDRPKIFAWRFSKMHGKQTMTAYLDKNDGAPRNGTSTDICQIFVCNITTQGVGETVATGVYSKKYRKLSITNLDLVANPFADNGGYFGRGGSQYKDKVK